MALVDTSVWIDFLKGRDSWQVACLNRLILNDVDIYSTGIIIQELLNGIKQEKERGEIGADFERFIIVQPSIQTHLEAAEIYNACRKLGLTIRSSVDCLIAALALEYDLAILQSNRDFQSIAKVYPLRLHTQQDSRT